MYLDQEPLNDEDFIVEQEDDFNQFESSNYEDIDNYNSLYNRDEVIDFDNEFLL